MFVCFKANQLIYKTCFKAMTPQGLGLQKNKKINLVYYTNVIEYPSYKRRLLFKNLVRIPAGKKNLHKYNVLI